jgi:hypothetical protein
LTLSNTATPKYYGLFRDAVVRGEIPVNMQVSMQMNRIDDLIANPGVYYDEDAVEGFIKYCENELTLTDGSDLFLLDSFKLWVKIYSDGIISLSEVFMNHTQTITEEGTSAS